METNSTPTPTPARFLAYGTEYRFTQYAPDGSVWQTGAVIAHFLKGIEGDHFTFESDHKYDDDGILRLGAITFGPMDTVVPFS